MSKPATSLESKHATSHESSDSDTEKSQMHVNTRQRRAQNKMATPVKTNTSPPPHPCLNIWIPPFWPEKPAIWFAQVVCQFEIMQVTDDRVKFYHILATLDRQRTYEEEDIPTGPPDFQRLKDELINRLSASRDHKVKQLLTHEQLGTRKPSQFLRYLRHLAGPDIPEEFVRTIWDSRLPTSMQPIVASQSTLPLDALAELADRVNDIAAPAHQVAATASPSPIDELTRQVAEANEASERPDYAVTAPFTDHRTSRRSTQPFHVTSLAVQLQKVSRLLVPLQARNRRS